MNINDIKHLAVERIYLIPEASDGELNYVWCDDPAPGVGMDASEAVEYVRGDIVAANEDKWDKELAVMDAQIIAEDHASRVLYAHIKTLRRWIMKNAEHKDGCPGSWDEDCVCGHGAILSQFPDASLEHIESEWRNEKRELESRIQSLRNEIQEQRKAILAARELAGVV